jgi:pilus assembly protein Flp/PilA
MSFKWYRAQGLVEYALILMLVALVVLVMLAIFGPAVGNMYSEVISQIRVEHRIPLGGALSLNYNLTLTDMQGA